jgi:uncharacterized RDD family membrane protein YckC
MPCLLCGDICRCTSDAQSAAVTRWLPDADVHPAAPPADLETPGADEPTHYPAEASAPDNGEGNECAPADSSPWRQEVAARLNRYQARRKPRPPRYPSLRLRFEDEDSVRSASGSYDESQAFPQRMTTSSNQALALDGFADSATHTADLPASAPAQAHAGSAAFPAPESTRRQTADAIAVPITAPNTFATTAPNTAPVAGKIIEFPRSWTPPLAALDELAEPVLDRDRPRILEAPEIVPPPPALGGITIEPAQQPELEKRPGIDIPLQSAPLERRILAAAIDSIIIAASCALFGFIFWKLTAIQPPRIQIIGLSAGLFGLFWAAYQYLLVIYAGTTPGLRLAQLELARFDGSRAGRRPRRWRVLASFLSAASLGMGYAWVFLDEDSLCWHDRITHTYLAPKG